MIKWLEKRELSELLYQLYVSFDLLIKFVLKALHDWLKKECRCRYLNRVLTLEAPLSKNLCRDRLLLIRSLQPLYDNLLHS